MFAICDLEPETARLLEMSKRDMSGRNDYLWPQPGKGLHIELEADADKAIRFFLDIDEGRRRSSLSLSVSEAPERKTKFQTRAGSRPLLRVDHASDPSMLRHANPDGTMIVGTHVHVMTEEFGDRLAFSISDQNLISPNDPSASADMLFNDFLNVCSILKVSVGAHIEGV